MVEKCEYTGEYSYDLVNQFRSIQYFQCDGKHCFHIHSVTLSFWRIQRRRQLNNAHCLMPTNFTNCVIGVLSFSYLHRFLDSKGFFIMLWFLFNSKIICQNAFHFGCVRISFMEKYNFRVLSRCTQKLLFSLVNETRTMGILSWPQYWRKMLISFYHYIPISCGIHLYFFKWILWFSFGFMVFHRNIESGARDFSLKFVFCRCQSPFFVRLKCENWSLAHIPLAHFS